MWSEHFAVCTNVKRPIIRTARLRLYILCCSCSCQVVFLSIGIASEYISTKYRSYYI